VCDYRDDCGDGSDERRYEVGFKCNIGSQGNRCVLPQRLTKDGVAQCNDASDLCLNNASSSCHKCFVSNDVIKTTQVNNVLRQLMKGMHNFDLLVPGHDRYEQLVKISVYLCSLMQSHRHGGASVSLAPQTELQAPQIEIRTTVNLLSFVNF